MSLVPTARPKGPPTTMIATAIPAPAARVRPVGEHGSKGRKAEARSLRTSHRAAAIAEGFAEVD